jgi:hypothetical protein
MPRRIQAFAENTGVVAAVKSASDVIGSARASKQPRHRPGTKQAGQWTKNPVPPDITGVTDVTSTELPGFKDETSVQWVSVRKFDALRGIVYGLVYEPNRLDSQGEFMTPENVELMAHRFLRLDLSQAIDTLHDELSNGCYPVESFVARDGDPDFPVGSWVVGIQLTPEFVVKYETGELNGFSFGARVTHANVEIEYEIMRDAFGSTEEMLHHSHLYFVHLNDTGRVTRGYTSEVMAHTHDILRASVTEIADGHVHRYFF